MTQASSRMRAVGARMLPALQNPLLLWAGFIIVHFALGLLGIFGTGLPLGDVTITYKYWVEYGFQHNIWVGIDTVWVYPIVAILPMLAAHIPAPVMGPSFYAASWLSLVTLLNAIAFAVLVGFHRDRRRSLAGWWWLLFLLLLGPIALGRIDTVVVAVAIPGILYVGKRPRVAAVLLTIATWMKVWPAAILGAVVVAIQRRLTVIATAIITSVVISVVALAFGAGANLFSFLSQQTGRGLQVEAPIATFWMWDVMLHRADPQSSKVVYDQLILTFEIQGPGVDIAAAVATPLLAISVLVLLVLGILAVRRGVDVLELLFPLVLALTISLILFNKVGSPQFVSWLAVPMSLGLVLRSQGHPIAIRWPVILTLGIAAMTQMIYPYLYPALLRAHPLLVTVLTVRNAAYVALFVIALSQLIRLVRADRPLPLTVEPSAPSVAS